ncbi:MAG: TerB family tellurite resistance protein [Myxococcales bacterium]|nr:TerB family tellurite resistance protein [Myxococcales bacterium]
MTPIPSIFPWFSSKPKQMEHASPLSRELAFVGLLVEMAFADSKLDDDELELVKRIVQERFSIQEEDALMLLQKAHEMMEKNYDYRPCTKTIAEGFSREDKLALIEDLWRVLLADQHVDVRESKLLRAVQLSLGLSLDDIEEARVRAEDAQKRPPLECSGSSDKLASS